MTDFIRELGPSFLAHLLRRLSDELVKGFEQWNEEVGIRAPPRTHSTLRALAHHGPLGVTELARLLRQSHPLIILWVRQLDELGLIDKVSDPEDGRRTVVRLTKAGRRDVEAQKAGALVIERVIGRLVEETGTDLVAGLWRMEDACRRVPFIDRLREETRRDSETLPGASSSKRRGKEAPAKS